MPASSEDIRRTTPSRLYAVLAIARVGDGAATESIVRSANSAVNRQRGDLVSVQKSRNLTTRFLFETQGLLRDGVGGGI